MNARSLTLRILRDIEQKDAYADIALDRALQGVTLPDVERRLTTELVYGIVRRRRTLDALIDQLATRPAAQQPPLVRLLLHIGLYQLRYLSHIPARAAVDTTVKLARENRLEGLAGLLNGILRRYAREAEAGDPLRLPADPIARLGLQHSYPDWIVALFVEQIGLTETGLLLAAMNQTPSLDLRVNRLRATPQQVVAALAQKEIAAAPLASLPTALRLTGRTGKISDLPGYSEGWWSVQDGSAQLVSHLIAPQAGETVLDMCAAPGGKSLHLAELMGDNGKVIALDKYAARLRLVEDGEARLGIRSVQVQTGDSRHQPQFNGIADRVLLDAPCSGLGTLHRHPDARWRQTPQTVAAVVDLQRDLLAEGVRWLKPGGTLVYSTCTLHPAENEDQLAHFLATHPAFTILPPEPDSPAAPRAQPDGTVKIWPHRDGMDGFFMVRLQGSFQPPA